MSYKQETTRVQRNQRVFLVRAFSDNQQTEGFITSMSLPPELTVPPSNHFITEKPESRVFPQSSQCLGPNGTLVGMLYMSRPPLGIIQDEKERKRRVAIHSHHNKMNKVHVLNSDQCRVICIDGNTFATTKVPNTTVLLVISTDNKPSDPEEHLRQMASCENDVFILDDKYFCDPKLESELVDALTEKLVEARNVRLYNCEESGTMIPQRLNELVRRYSFLKSCVHDLQIAPVTNVAEAVADVIGSLKISQ